MHNIIAAARKLCARIWPMHPDHETAEQLSDFERALDRWILHHDSDPAWFLLTSSRGAPHPKSPLIFGPFGGAEEAEEQAEKWSRYGNAMILGPVPLRFYRRPTK